MIKKANIKKSPVKGKQLRASFEYRGRERVVDFGDPTMREYPGTRRGDSYCARSFGIRNARGKRTAGDPLSANYWSRRKLWNCKGVKSLKKKGMVR